jgi:phthalate 4,5-cis-dihydrodiol dehydrogenase
VTATRTLRIGICGLGVAFTHIAAALPRDRGLEFAAAMDVRRGALDAFAREYGGRTYDEFDALCADDEIDAIYIATPNADHAQQAIQAASHGKHVVVDKPMALSVEECEAMNRAAEANGVLLLCGHVHSYGAAVRAMRRIIVSGELGPLRMISTWHFNEWVYRPRAAWEFDPRSGGNVVFNQGAHQVDIVRLLGGGLVRSVRATIGRWDRDRPIEGAYTAFLDFEDGTAASLVYNGYAHFDTAELTSWIGEMPRNERWNRDARRRLDAMLHDRDENAAKDAWRFGGASEPGDGAAERPQVLFGITIASCERGDIRQTPFGLRVYGDHDVRDVAVAGETTYSAAALENLYDAVVHGKSVLRDGRWGQATVEVLCAMTASSHARAEVSLSHQVAGSE